MLEAPHHLLSEIVGSEAIMKNISTVLNHGSLPSCIIIVNRFSPAISPNPCPTAAHCILHILISKKNNLYRYNLIVVGCWYFFFFCTWRLFCTLNYCNDYTLFPNSATHLLSKQHAAGELWETEVILHLSPPSPLQNKIPVSAWQPTRHLVHSSCGCSPTWLQFYTD